DINLVDKWSKYFETFKGFKIGICWQADVHKNSDNTTVQDDAAKKSIPVKLLAQLAKIPGVQLFSLQKINGLEQLKDIPENSIHIFKNLDEESGPFMDTAAIMMHMDLIITIDTSIAHLAGGLGRKVWLLLPHHADWRWMLERRDSPW